MCTAAYGMFLSFFFFCLYTEIKIIYLLNIVDLEFYLKCCCVLYSVDIKNAREGTRSPRTAHEISLKRSYESVEGNIKQAMSMRESPVSAPLEGKVLFPEYYLDIFNFVK